MDTKPETIEAPADAPAQEPIKGETVRLPFQSNPVPATLPVGGTTPLDLINRAVSGNAQVEVLERLLGLQERWEKGEARKAFEVAVAKAKSEIPVILKGNVVDFTTARGRTNYAYEDLATIARTIDPILAKYGLSYRWRPNSDDKWVTVTCILSHAMGHSEENTLKASHDASGNKNAIQAVGSAVTYLQRYTLKAALGLSAAQDDDGRGGAPQGQPPAGAAPSKPAPAPAQKPPPPTQKPTNPEVHTFPVVKVDKIFEKKSDASAKKPWTAYCITFDDGYAKLDAWTFDKNIADLANELANTGENGSLKTEPGRKPGSKQIVSLTRAEQPPQSEPQGAEQPELGEQPHDGSDDDVPM